MIQLSKDTPHNTYDQTLWEYQLPMKPRKNLSPKPKTLERLNNGLNAVAILLTRETPFHKNLSSLNQVVDSGDLSLSC